MGGAFGFIDAFRSSRSGSKLPLDLQIAGIAAIWCIAALLGLFITALVLAGIHLLQRFLKMELAVPIWPSGFSLSFLLALSIFSFNYDSPMVYFLGIGLAIIAFTVYSLGSSKYRFLTATSFWAFLNVAEFVILFSFLSFSSPIHHGLRGKSIFSGLLVFLGFSLAMFLSVSAKYKRRILFGLIAAFIFLVADYSIVSTVKSRRPESARPSTDNIILITIDTLRSDHLGCYGNNKILTENMDRIASEGILYKNCMSPIPLTNPSHASILTGLYPPHHGILLNGESHLNPGIKTLPDVLSQRGYKTAAFVSGHTLKNWVCHFSEQFELYEDNFSPSRILPDSVFESIFAKPCLAMLKRIHFLGDLNKNSRIAEKVIKEAGDWISLNSDSPFFLWLHVFDPHGPYSPPPPYNKMYYSEYSTKVDGDWIKLTDDQKIEMLKNEGYLEQFKSLYAGEVSYVDDQIGVFLNVLRRMRLLEKTMIILTADHGESLTEHNYYFDHSVCLYDPSLKVPLIFRLPNKEHAGDQVDDLVRLVDIFPTVLDYCRIRFTEKVDGRPLLGNKENPRIEEPALSFVFPGEIQGNKKLLSVRTSNYKYIRTSSWWGDLLLMPESEELYNIQEDPKELRNLLFEEPDMLNKFRLTGESYWTSWMNLKQKSVPKTSKQDMDKLRSLGYFR